MLGLGSNMMKHPVTGKSIVRDGLVLQHNYNLSSVEPLSSGAADINADAAANEYIDVGVIPITTNDVSISAWVHITTWVNYAPIFSNRSASGTNPGVELRCANGVQKFQLLIDDANGSSSAAISSTLNSNQWYHVCGVWDRSGNMSLYIDGVLDGTDDITGNPLTLTHSTSAKIGATLSTEMRGYVCNVGYWNAALTQAQVKSIMNKNYDSLSASEKEDLVSWWNLDSVIPDSTTLVYDNHHGGGEILGGEEVTCGDFSCAVPTDYWSFNSNWTIDQANNKAISDGSQSGNVSFRQLNSIMDLTTGSQYKVQFTISGYVAGEINPHIRGNQSGNVSGDGIKTSYITAGSGSDGINLYAGSTFEGSISNISVKEINGNTGTLS